MHTILVNTDSSLHALRSAFKASFQLLAGTALTEGGVSRRAFGAAFESVGVVAAADLGSAGCWWARAGSGGGGILVV